MGKGNDPNCGLGTPMPDPMEGSSQPTPTVWLSKNGEVIPGGGDAFTLRYDDFEVTLLGALDMPETDTVMMMDEDGSISHQSPLVVMHMREGTLTGEDGATTLTPGMYAITSARFERFGDLGGAGTFTLSDLPQPPVDAPDLGPLPGYRWTDLSTDEAQTLVDAYHAWDFDDFDISGVSLYNIASRPQGYYDLTQQERAARNVMLKDALQSLQQKKLVTECSKGYWMPTPQGEHVTATPNRWPQLSAESASALSLFDEADSITEHDVVRAHSRFASAWGHKTPRETVHDLRGWFLIEHDGNGRFTLTDHGKAILATRAETSV